MKNDKVEIDIRDNKVKQGSLLKQSRHLKQWKQRWMVLTKTHLYSFASKGQYKDPTQIIDLKDVQTIKSYYKQQYKRPHIFRVESPQVNLHMSAKSNDEKWAWMTAIQKMIDRIIHPQLKPDTYNLIRETIKMATAVRQTLQKKQQKQRKQSIDFSQSLLKKLRMSLNSQIFQESVVPQVIIRQSRLPQQQQTFFIIDNKKTKSSQQSPNQIQQKLSTNQSKVIENQPKVIEKVTQKIVEVPVQRVVQKIIKVPQIRQKIVQKIVKVPQIREKVIQKIVYKQSPKDSTKQILAMLKELMMNPGENPRPLIDFVIYLLTSNAQQYQSQVLQFCLDQDSRRFFSEMFLLMMNQETDQSILNSYLKFILVLYENTDEFFYSSDLKALIGILIRQIQMNRSEFNQYLIMCVLKAMAQKDWWSTLNYRRSQIKIFIKQLQSISGPENQYLASTLLQKL